MARYFDGLIGCSTLEHVKTIAKELNALDYMHSLENQIFRNRDGLWWASFIPKGLGYGVPHDTDLDRKNYQHRLPEMAVQIYEVLRRFETYEIAMLGWEIEDDWFDPCGDDYIMYTDIRVPTTLDKQPGLIVSKQIWETLPETKGFERFNKNLFWVHHQNWVWASDHYGRFRL